ncbi:MAG: V-type ATPase 116kDa subunit family protein, partial [bacterium]|nr:V-type ATPase 116kDa subunit family protein [bacterium]
MSVEKLKKVQVIGHNSQMETFLEKLHRHDLIQIEDIKETLPDLNFTLEADHNDRGLEDILKQIKFLIDLFEKYKEKSGFLTGMFNSRIELTPSEFEEIISNFNVADIYAKYHEIYSKINNLYIHNNNLLVTQERLRQWTDLEIPLENIGKTKFTTSVLGYVKSDIFYQFIEDLQSLSYVEADRISSESSYFYVFLLYHNSISSDVSGIFNQYDFRQVAFPEERGLVRNRLISISETIELNNSKINSLEEKLKCGVEFLSKLYVIYDFFKVKLQKLKGHENLGLTESTFTLTGWIPEKNLESFSELCNSDPDFRFLDIELNDPTGDDSPPILLKNPKIIKPFQMITDLYGRPNYFEIDPTFFFLPFFTLFFGVCLTDGGYGLVMLIILGSLFLIPGLRKKMKDAPALLVILFLSSIPTIIMGVLTGGFFGIQFPEHIKKYILLDPLDPVKGINFMKFTIFLGLIHLFIGFITNFIKSWRQGNKKEAIHKNIPWMIIMPSLLLLVYKLLGANVKILIPGITFLIGVMWVVLFDSYDHPVFIKRVMKGAYNAFFGITG